MFLRLKKQKLKNLKDSEIIIWTTTPWTIPANKALAYNENLNYCIIQLKDEGQILKIKKLLLQKYY